MASQTFFSQFCFKSPQLSQNPLVLRTAFFCSRDWQTSAVSRTAFTASYRTISSGSSMAAMRAGMTSGCSGVHPMPARYLRADFFLWI